MSEAPVQAQELPAAEWHATLSKAKPNGQRLLVASLTNRHLNPVECNLAQRVLDAYNITPELHNTPDGHADLQVTVTKAIDANDVVSLVALLDLLRSMTTLPQQMAAMVIASELKKGKSHA